ncbi:MAG: O-antigen ligase family protein [Chloroflexi bacterium]|nr:O-antigen ligase family protein [Chloroflexota bacterium]
MSAGPRTPTGGPAQERAREFHTAPRGLQLRALKPVDLGRLAALALVGAWAGYLILTPMPALSFHVFPQTLTLHLVIACAAALYVAWLAASRRLPGGTPLDLPVLVLLGAYGIATYASIDWRASLEPVLLLGAAVVAFYVLSGLPLLSARTLRFSFMLTGLALAIYALWVVGNDYADYLRLTRDVEGIGAGNVFPPTVPRVHGVSDHPNVLAMVLVLLLPFYALSAYRPFAWWERVLGAAGLFAAGWAIFLTLSRGGWIGTAVAIVFTVAAAWITTSVYQRERDGERLTWETFVPAGFSPTALAAVVGALALAFFGALAFIANSSTRPGWLFRGSLSAREDAWHAGIDIFKDNVLTGSGPNTFGQLYPQYGRHPQQFVVHTQHAHNGFLQVADDAGLLGVAALVAIAAALAYMLWRTWREGSLEARLVAVACAGALAGFAAHQQLDAGNIWKAPAFALAFVGAVIARSYAESVRPSAASSSPARTYGRYASFAGRAALPLFLIPLLYGWYRVDAAHYDYWRGLDAWNQGDAAGIARLQDAVNADSSMMVYQLELGVAQATAYNNTGRTNDDLLNSARIHLERAAEIDPRSDLARANLARVYELTGRDDDAAREAQLTRLADYHVTPVLVAGEVYEDLGRDADAVSTYGQVISMDAGLANSTFWEKTAWRRDHLDEILLASTIGINPCTYGAYLVEAYRTGVRESLDGLEKARDDCQFLAFTGDLGNDLALRVALAKIQLTLGQRDEALGHLMYAVDRQPDFGPARTELGRWYAEGRDIEAARHQWVVGGELGEGESLRQLGDTYPAGQVPRQVRDRLEDLVATSGSSVRNDLISVLYYRMRYARLSPVFALIPGTWQDAVPRPYAEWQNALARWDAGESPPAR